MSKKEISRRSFLKGTAAAGASVAAASLLPRITMAEGDDVKGEFKWETGVFTDEETGWKLCDEEGNMIREGRGANGANAVVSAGTPWAAKAGLEVLKKGGNAVDAAAAVAFAISVTEPQASGIGGGGFMTLRDKDGNVKFINFRETAPALAKENYWPVVYDEAKKSFSVVGGASTTGGRSVGVPGTVAGMAYAVEKYGTLPLADAIQPAIDLCENGFFIGPTTAKHLDSNYANMLAYPEFGDIYLLPEEAADELGRFTYATGDLFKNTQQAKALKLIQEQGADGFYKGELQDAMIKVANKYGGVFQPKDFELYRAQEKEPVKGTFMGKTVVSVPHPVAQHPGSLWHRQAEGLRPQQPRVHPCPGRGHEDGLRRPLQVRGRRYPRRHRPGPHEQGVCQVPGQPHQGRRGPGSRFPRSLPVRARGHHPLHRGRQGRQRGGRHLHHQLLLRRQDRTQGLRLHAERRDGRLLRQSLQPQLHRAGQVPPELHEPHHRPQRGWQPLRGGRLPGGTTIIVAVAQVILNTVLFGMDMQEAIEAPRFSEKGSGLQYEARIPQDTIDKLVAMGHNLSSSAWGEWDMSAGSTQGVLYAADGTLHGGADPRRDNKAFAF